MCQTRRPGVGDFQEAESVDVILFSPEETKFLTSAIFGTYRIWEIESQEMVMELTGPDAEIAATAFSTDGEVLATLSREGVTVWDVNSNARIGGFKIWQADTRTFTSDGKELLVADNDALARWTRTAIGEKPELIAEKVAIGSLVTRSIQESPISLSLDALNNAWDRLDALDMP